MKSEPEIIVIEYNEKKYMLKVMPFDSEIDTEEITGIDISNILGEVLTFPVVMNKLGIIRAEMNRILKQTKVYVDINLAKLNKEAGLALIKLAPKSNTVDNRQTWVVCHPRYLELQEMLIEAERQFEVLDSLYWSAKSKDEKLNKMSHNLVPSEFELEKLQGVVNRVLIKGFDNFNRG